MVDIIIRIHLQNLKCLLLSGAASAPTALSVVWDPPSAVVSFQSPVYGGECVDYYVVTAVSEEEERNVSCNTTSVEHECRLSLDGTANDYKFTVHAVTVVNDSFLFIGENNSDCCKFLLVKIVTGVLFQCRFTISRECCCRRRGMWTYKCNLGG